MNDDRPKCAPLCGASKAYGRFDQPWKHEPECPVRKAWEAERRAYDTWDYENAQVPDE